MLAALLFAWQAHASGSAEYCDSLIKKSIAAMADRKNYAECIEMLQNADVTAEKNGHYQQQFLAQNNMGILYFNTLDYGEALNHYLEAYTIAIKHLTDKETMSVVNNIAILYSKEKNYPKAMEYFLQVKNLAESHGDKERTGIYSINLGAICNKLNDSDGAEEHLKYALSCFVEESPYIPKIKAAFLQTDMLRGRYSKVVDDGLRLLASDHSRNNPDISAPTSYLVASAYFELGEMTKAADMLSSILSSGSGVDTKIEAYNLMADICYRRHDYRGAMVCKDSVLALSDSLNRIKNVHQLENSKIRFELQESRYQLRLKEIQLSNERHIFIASLCALAVVMILLIWVLRVRASKRRQKKEIAQNKLRITSLELEQERKEKLIIENRLREKETKHLLEQEKLKNEIEIRNRQLTAKALVEASHNQFLEEITTALSGCAMTSGNCMRLVGVMKERINGGTGWQDFINHFDKVNYGMLSALKKDFPDLNSNDTRFLSYVYMNLSSKEIASIFNITAEACRKRKERIKAKMNLNSDADLYSFLCDFSRSLEKGRSE